MCPTSLIREAKKYFLFKRDLHTKPPPVFNKKDKEVEKAVPLYHWRRKNEHENATAFPWLVYLSSQVGFATVDELGFFVRIMSWSEVNRFERQPVIESNEYTDRGESRELRSCAKKVQMLRIPDAQM